MKNFLFFYSTLIGIITLKSIINKEDECDIWRNNHVFNSNGRAYFNQEASSLYRVIKFENFTQYKWKYVKKLK